MGETMVKTKAIGIAEAVANGWLEDRKVYLTAVVNNSNNKYDTDKNHIGYWRFEGSVMQWELPRLRGVKDKLFPSGDKQKEFFEAQLGLNLDPYDDESFFYTAPGKVTVRKEERLFGRGIEFDLKNPMEYIRYKILAISSENYLNRNICPAGEEPLPQKDVLRFVYDGLEKKKVQDDVDKYKTLYFYIGEIKANDDELRKFLTLMNYERGERLEVPSEWGGEKMLLESQRLIDNDLFRDIAYRMINNKETYSIKILMYDAVRASAIDKLGRGLYRINWIPGQELEYRAMIDELKTMKENQEDDYLKIIERIDAWKKRKEAKAAK